VFLIDHRTGVMRVIQKWYGAEFARYWKFKSDRCGIEIFMPPMGSFPCIAFKSDRCGIEIPLPHL